MPNVSILQESRFGLIAMALATLAAVAVHATNPQSTWPLLLLALAFAGAVLNIIVNEQLTGTVSDLDLGLLLVTGFAATVFGTPSISQEALHATVRMLVLGSAVGAFAWLYWRMRGIAGLSLSDVKLVAVLGAFLPLAVGIYTIAFAITLTIAVLSALHLWRGDQPSLQSRLPIASLLTGAFYLVWAVYRLS